MDTENFKHGNVSSKLLKKIKKSIKMNFKFYGLKKYYNTYMYIRIIYYFNKLRSE